MGVGENIKFFRKQKGLTQKELGEIIHMSPNSIQRYELGHRDPQNKTLEVIAKALGVSMADLLGIEKKVYDLTDILSKNEGKSINNPTTEEKERLKKTIELAGKISSDVINKINDEALDGMIAIGRYSSLDDEMEILKKATDKQIENILDSLGKQLEFELFKLKNDIENKK